MSVFIFIIIVIILCVYLFANNYSSDYYKYPFIGMLFALLIYHSKTIKYHLNRPEKTASSIDIMNEYNFVNSVRNMTHFNKEKNDKLKADKKKFIAEQQKGRCNHCKEALGEYELDLIESLARGGRYELRNLQALCLKCHHKKQSIDNFLK
jgi:5-methylcytosine-specific restriction endonuclease McrA